MSELTPQALGFQPIPGDDDGWLIELRGRRLVLRSLHSLDDMMPIDDIQRIAIAASEYDLIPANEMVVVLETGGHVLAAYDGPRMLAGGYAWGGFVQGRARLVSDFLGVLPEARSLGLGEAMKRLQAAIAWRDGFEEIVWTVDPLRAANARLNFAKLGATCRHYERNRYGEHFAVSHYGGLPTDRLHLQWAIREQRVIDRLTDAAPEPDLTAARLVRIPADFDALVATDREAALRRRLAVRDELEALFDEGWCIDGFIRSPDPEGDPALVLHRT